ncbi:Glycosyltransferase, catalytic subunit of cellulose synthase and poly-beta-1,6-N-acetylglucosamine synthase [Geosporobacter subterraneus DSM 17957]|uniref:Glycosyltransferase, catalytic subunit of cellulose synthase and poly-beta-1,6-N-acetylglucosamine synthase n=1 Tax=Geosporobacter subterraneus DSM 17957 TaxID=1121919 RepID=A0A1M6NZ63_9FIRM|nr:glycosyltransferase [Geosporobacter subterraneus]SHK01005.1 Glycosyltransferase, catalytic subunit of cellulose synthase and poly-beta-1,6-N-acetylglucosamine synthase [Geosporobacter subterraneus DSM 17957]
MNNILFIISTLFLIILTYYSVLTIWGIYYRGRELPSRFLDKYPSVDILIPAHNEGKVIGKTLDAMTKIKYPGELQIYLLDDNSQDETSTIAESYSKLYKNMHHIRVPIGKPKGKSRVLNYGLSISNSEYFAVYDADNCPEPKALRLLIEAVETFPDAMASVGYVKTINEGKNWLTRMISLEFQVFQLLMQSGRWLLFKTGSLTGTNMVVRRTVIEKIGGYDVYALAEDAELTMTITRLGGLIPVVPESRTWEQEPESLRVLLKQRTRWLQGNLYLLEKMFSSIQFFKGRVLVHSLQQILIYVVFLVFLLISHVWFALGLLGYWKFSLAAPTLLIWYVSYIIYTSQLFSAQAVEKSFSPMNIFIGFIMYFTYAQFFIYLFVRSLFYYIKAKRRKEIIPWDKTIRF